MRFEKKEIDLTIIENSEGLLITQNGKTYLAEKWKLTEVVLEIINLSIENGFDKFWVHGHPKNGATKAHYICFSRSHDKLLPRLSHIKSLQLCITVTIHGQYTESRKLL